MNPAHVTPGSPLAEDTDALIAFACQVRPDWDRDALAAAIGGARSNGWTFRRIAVEVVRLAVDDTAHPRVLAVAASAAASAAHGDGDRREVFRRGSAALRQAAAAAGIELPEPGQ